jgi:hypothetical protein
MPKGGSRKGIPNGVNADVRGMMLQALHNVGGVRYLAKQALENPSVFMSLLAKVMPAHIVSDGANHLHFHLEAAMRVSQELQGQAKRIVTLEPQAQDAPPASLLDAPLPEE